MFLMSPGTYLKYQTLIFYSQDGQIIFASPCSPWGKNRSFNLPLTFPGIVGVYVPSLGELVIVVLLPIHNLHTHKHIDTQLLSYRLEVNDKRSQPRLLSSVIVLSANFYPVITFFVLHCKIKIPVFF